MGGLLGKVSKVFWGIEPTYTGHLGQVELVTVEAVAGVAFSHADAATVLAPIQDPTFLCLETLKALVAL